MDPEFITQLEPPVLPVSLENTEPATLIKDEPPESEIAIDEVLDEELIPDIKDTDIVWHTLCEDSIKSETVPEYIFETETENDPFVKIENITESENSNKTEDTSDGNGQEMVEDQGNLEPDKQHVLNVSNNLNDISVRSQKPKHPEKRDLAECYKTRETTLWEEIKEKIKVIEAPEILVKPREYITIAKDKHVCNHCQQTCKRLTNLKTHIKKMHREVTTMYQCPYCSYKSKWTLRRHIFRKHNATKYCCDKCGFASRKYSAFKTHELSHKTDNQDLKYRCDKCDFKTNRYYKLKKHKIIHLKPEEIQYFYCYHCSYKSSQKGHLKAHIFRHLKHVEIKYDRSFRFSCDDCNYKPHSRYALKLHRLIHLKPEEIQYFYCYHCSYKANQKSHLKIHIFWNHFKNVETKQKRKWHRCDQCGYKIYSDKIWQRHKLIHLKPEEIEYFYCHHCSFKSKQKSYLEIHIFRHFQKEEIKFQCYICDFMTLKRELIIGHIKKKHSKVQIKSEINEGN